VVIFFSFIFDKNATRIFHQGSSSNTITLSNCTVDSYSSNGYLTTQNTVTKSFILGLNHMSTQNCHSEYDFAGTLTPIIQTSKKQICYTFKRLFEYCPHGNFVALASILHFNFIHQYAFSDVW
jgi:hypothetical protein